MGWSLWKTDWKHEALIIKVAAYFLHGWGRKLTDTDESIAGEAAVTDAVSSSRLRPLTDSVRTAAAVVSCAGISCCKRKNKKSQRRRKSETEFLEMLCFALTECSVPIEARSTDTLRAQRSDNTAVKYNNTIQLLEDPAGGTLMVCFYSLCTGVAFKWAAKFISRRHELCRRQQSSAYRTYVNAWYCYA